jgi:hypothetical protein
LDGHVKSILAEVTEQNGGFQPIIDLGYPIVGIVSDGQQSIRLAMETLLPEVPYQYCQYHY